MSRRFKIGNVEEELRPLTHKDFSRHQIERLAMAVMVQSIAIVLGLKEDKREFSRDREVAFWTQLSKDNLWFQILSESDFGVDDVEEMSSKVLAADPDYIRAKIADQHYPIKRRRFK